MKTVTHEITVPEFKKPKANLKDTIRLIMEIIRTTVPIAILGLQVMSYYQ